jgi:DnaJ-class molecular chaperone
MHRSGGRGGFRGFGGFDDIIKEMFGGGGRAGSGTHFDANDLAGSGRDVSAAVTITLPEAAKGTTRRVHLPNGKELDVKIPAGLADGKQIRLKGQGLPGPTGPGDVLITVSVATHPTFERAGADLRLELPVTLYEAVLGAKVRVPTLDGALEVAIPPGTSSGRTFRFKGKGFPAKEGTGDLLATVRIVLPERADADLEELMRKWRDKKRYDPRRDMS